ncbi:MAG: aldose 1-epimerase [Hyphomonas sp.]|uniref:aldose 1-epimerase n=1 Tax=Hyphomonas sp. TaxID=87 RepID=UPI0034A01725
MGLAGALTLVSGEWYVQVDAARGGQVIACRWRGHEVFTTTSPGVWPAQADAGCFALVPFSNRIRQAAFSFFGNRVSLPAPAFAMPHALHGLGWRQAWSCQAPRPGELIMVHTHAGGAWPWPYEASQHLSLAGNRLTLTLALRNTGTQPMPAGIGLHPYFPRRPDLALCVQADGYWKTDAANPGIPTSWSALSPDRGVFAEESPDTVDLDTCFTGWNGKARLDYSDPKLRIELTASAAFSNLVIYCPAGKNILCLEPVSHVNDAVNLADLSALQQMDRLEPGGCLAGTVVIDVCEPG